MLVKNECMRKKDGFIYLSSIQERFFCIRNSNYILERKRNSTKFKCNYRHFVTPTITKIIYFSEDNSGTKWIINQFEKNHRKKIP